MPNPLPGAAGGFAKFLHELLSHAYRNDEYVRKASIEIAQRARHPHRLRERRAVLAFRGELMNRSNRLRGWCQSCRWVVLVSAALGVVLVTEAAYAAVVNINSRTNNRSNPVEIELAPGVYSVRPIGVEEGGSFDSWSPWISTSCSGPDRCPRTRPTTKKGWITDYAVCSPDIEAVSVEGTVLEPVIEQPTGVESFFLVTGEYVVREPFVYPTALGALANAQSSIFTLSAPGLVGFGITDSSFALGDNRGGMSLEVLPVSDVTRLVRPDRGGDTGAVTVRIIGGQFEEGAAVFLRHAGQTEIVGSPVSVEGGGFTIVATFDLVGKAQGRWDVVVDNPTGADIVLPEAFTIEEGRTAQVWVDIIGRDVIRVGRVQTFNIIYGNRGNVNAVGVPLWIAGIPNDATLNLGFEIAPLPLPDGQLAVGVEDVPIAFDAGGEVVIPLIVPVIPPASNGVLTITLTVPTARSFQLQTWVSPPLYSSPVAIGVIACIRTGLNLIPGFSCLGSILDETAEILVDTHLNGANTVIKYGDLIFNIVDDCIGEITLINNKLEAVKKAILFFRGGAAIADACVTSFGRTDEANLPVRTVASMDPNDKVGSRGGCPGRC